MHTSRTSPNVPRDGCFAERLAMLHHQGKVQRMRVVVSRLSIAASLLCALPARHAAAYDGPVSCALPTVGPMCEPEPWSRDPHSDDSCVPLSPAFELRLPAMSDANASDPAAARASFERANALYESGALEDAVLHLRVVERALPRIADRIALRRAELLRKLGLPKEACDAYQVAKGSPDRGTATRAEIGMAYCLLEAGDKSGESAFQSLVRRYPNLGERHALRLLLAHVREQAGQLSAAVALLRSIDLEAPASQEASTARAELARLAEQGAHARPFSGLELADRAERLWREADVEVAAAEVDRVLADPKLSAEARGRLHMLAARIARQQGYWDRATTEAQQAQRAGASDAGSLIADVTPSAQRADEQRAAAEKQARALRGNKPLAKLGSAQLRALFELAMRNDLRDLLDEVLVALSQKTALAPTLRFEVAMRAAGVADPTALATLLATVVDVPSLRLPARYHLGRAYERAGRTGEAEAAYVRVLSDDRGSTPYYAMWAEQRLRALHDPVQARNATSPLGAASAAASTPIMSGPPPRSALVQVADAGTSSPLLALSLSKSSTPSSEGGGEPIADSGDEGALDAFDVLGMDTFGAPAPPPGPEPNLDEHARIERVRELLTPIIASYGDSYPWLGRALDLAELGELDEAADEMSEAYLAWRDAIGAPRLRSGLLALLTGSAPPRRVAPFATRAARRSLDARTRALLSSAAKLLGDPGIGLRLGAFRPDSRPRAYASIVDAAARRYGIDPNLLFAVMRVESIYNRRIISTVGAIGLMQIMPSTGRRIAQHLGVDDFKVADLLDPKVNVDFAAWYLSSLIKRFDGRLPLAIASYNGGPHNVRLWMHRTGPDMPLDAFLERIPFSQTHLYVRRVLTHYAAYRAQQQLPMTMLAVDLPAPKPDDMAF